MILAAPTSAAGIGQQIVTIVAVLVGAAASFIATSSVESWKWKRTHKARWDVKRLEAYVDYANAIKRMNHLSMRLAATRGLHKSEGAGPAAINLEDGVSQLAKAEAARGEAWEAVRLLGGKAVAAGEACNRNAWELEAFARGTHVDSEEWKKVHLAQIKLRFAFYHAARADLGVDETLPLRGRGRDDDRPNHWPGEKPVDGMENSGK